MPDKIADRSNGQGNHQRAFVHQPPRLEDTPTKTSYWWIWLVLGILVVGGLAALIVPRLLHGSTTAPATGGGKGKGAGGPVPVVAAKARKGSLDIYLNGLGTVTPLKTVSIHTRVDGQLDKVLYTEGQLVKAGDLLCEIDPRPFQAMLTQAQGQLTRDQALLKDAQANLGRFQQLLAGGQAVTQAQVDTQAALVDQYLGAVTTDNGVINADQLNIEYCKITAPFDGRIGLRLVDPGNIVHASDTNALAVITQIQPITVLFTIAEDDIQKVMEKLDPKNPMAVEAWDRDLTKQLTTGTLLAVDNQVDPTTGTVKLKGLFDNKKDELYPNEFVNARLRLETLKDVIIVPAAAVQRGPDSSYLFIVKDDKTINMQTVTVGPTEGNNTVILTGVTAGQLVVTDGVDKLQNNTPVEVRERTKKKGAATQPGATQPAGTDAPATQPSGDASQPNAGHRHGKQGGAE